MMCWKRASADMQSLGKHVEGMIHLKTTEALKTEAFFLTFIMWRGSEETGQWNRLSCLTLIFPSSHLSAV